MRTVVLGTPPIELERLIALRRATGANLHDEVWNGEYHMAPAPRIPHAKLDSRVAVLLERFASDDRLEGVGPFNLGQPDNYRVPDRGLLRAGENGVYASTAARVDEVVVVNPEDRSVTWLRLDSGEYRPFDRSIVLDIDVAQFVAQIDWPPTED
jgi:hypothetical protein